MKSLIIFILCYIYFDVVQPIWDKKNEEEGKETASTSSRKIYGLLASISLTVFLMPILDKPTVQELPNILQNPVAWFLGTMLPVFLLIPAMDKFK